MRAAPLAGKSPPGIRFSIPVLKIKGYFPYRCLPDLWYLRNNFSRFLTNTKVHLEGKFTSEKKTKHNKPLLNVASLYQNSSCPRPTGLFRLKKRFRNAFVHVLVFVLKCFVAQWLYQHSRFLPLRHPAVSENSPESGKEIKIAYFYITCFSYEFPLNSPDLPCSKRDLPPLTTSDS